MSDLEKKIASKAKNILKGFILRANDVNCPTAGNIKTFVSDTTNAMLKIIKAEVNIRLQERKHHG